MDPIAKVGGVPGGVVGHGASGLMALDAVRGRLAKVWLLGSGLTFVVVAVQSLLGHYADKTQEAWGWLLPTIMPTVGMILTVLTYTALDPSFSKVVVRRDFFRVAQWLSIIY